MSARIYTCKSWLKRTRRPMPMMMTIGPKRNPHVSLQNPFCGRLSMKSHPLPTPLMKIDLLYYTTPHHTTLSHFYLRIPHILLSIAINPFTFAVAVKAGVGLALIVVGYFVLAKRAQTSEFSLPDSARHSVWHSSGRRVHVVVIRCCDVRVCGTVLPLSVQTYIKQPYSRQSSSLNVCVGFVVIVDTSADHLASISCIFTYILYICPYSSKIVNSAHKTVFLHSNKQTTPANSIASHSHSLCTIDWLVLHAHACK